MHWRHNMKVYTIKVFLDKRLERLTPGGALYVGKTPKAQGTEE